jgi:acyl-homoserine lactone acylase PvdQ
MAMTAIRVVFFVLLAAVTVNGAWGQTTLGRYQEFGDARGFLNILPPGSDGLLNATEAVQAQLGTYPAHVVDQLVMYGELVYETPGLAEDRILEFFKDASFGVREDDIERMYSPTSDVVVVRDASFGVPHIYGETRYATMFAQGYTGAEDRLFLMDVLRHLGRARLSEFLGASPANQKMDREQLAVAPYTEADLTAQIQDIAAAGAEGAQAYADLLAYTDGVNAYVDEASSDADKLPAEYPALQQLPAAWKPEDAVAIASLVGGIFGKGGGGELLNFCGLQEMILGLGSGTAAREVFDDLHFANDAEAPTTSSIAAPYMTDLGPTNPAAHPDIDCDTLTPIDAGGPPLSELLLAIGEGVSGLLPSALSNALLVGAEHTRDGRPIAVFGPQTAYFMPQLLVEKDVHGPGIDARGVAFAGTDLYVQLGRGRDFAFSATSAGADNIDQWVLRLCEPGGGTATTASMGYLRNGVCEPIEAYDHVQIAKPSAGGIPGTSESGTQCVGAGDDDGDGFVNDGCPAVALPELPILHCGNAIDDDLDGAVNDGCPPIAGTDLVLSWPVERTAHYGPLVARGTLTDGTPIAVATLRSTYRNELGSVRGFLRVNDPDYMANGFDSFRTAVGDGVDYTFNWFYIDGRDIGYQHSCKCPQRAAGVDPYLPAWGDGQWDWQGFLPLTAQPWDLNPAQGYITSWNNKQAPGFRANDRNFSYGPTYRSQMLDLRLEAAIAAGDVARNDVIDAMADAGTVDLRGQEDLPLLLAVLGTTAPGGGDPRAQEMRDRLAAWMATEAHRRDHDRDGFYDDPQAPAIMDAWWPRLVHAMFDAASGDAVNALAITIDDGDRTNHLGSAFNNGMYGQVHKDLRRVLSQPVADPWSRAYCGNGNLAACRAALWSALDQTAADLEAEFGSANVADWRRTLEYEDVRHTAAGVTMIPAIHWINRPTFQQVVQIGEDIDPFKCYRARRAHGTAKPAPVTVSLADDFESKSMVVSKIDSLCNAADVEAQGVADPSAHLACQRIKDAPGEPRFVRRQVMISDRFGSRAVVLQKPWSLCAPSLVDGVGGSLPLDYFKCYRARLAGGQGRFPRQTIEVEDGFETKDTLVLKPFLVCSVANVDDGGTIDPSNEMACYKIKDASGQSRFERRDVAVSSDVAEQVVTVRKAATLCVPATISTQ